jgi:hypothetical protein
MATNDARLPAAAKPTSKDKTTRMLLLVVGVVIYSGFVYGSGMEAELRKARTVNEQRKVVEQDYRDAQRKLRLRIAAVQQLEARRQLDLALAELDKRNFGTAQDHIGAAAKLLAAAQAADSTNPDMSVQIQALQKTNLAVTADMSSQRDALLAVATQMDTAFNGNTAGFIDESVKDDSAHPIKKATANDVPIPPDKYKGSDLAGGEDHPK